MDSLLSPLRYSQGRAGYNSRLRGDPLGGKRTPQPQTVAPRAGVSTVNSAVRRGRSLTAILISDQRSVAVIDEAVVGVGDRLPDGARVDAIQSDRVVVVERNGQRRVLTLTTGR
jgi:Flp pilus assembly protein CpaB